MLETCCFFNIFSFGCSVRDKAREKQRQKNLASKLPRQPRVEEAIRAPKKERKETANKRRLHQNRDDEEEMDREYRLLKKLKKGTLSEQEYDDEVMSLPDTQPVEPTSNVSEDLGNVDLNGRTSSDSKLSKKIVQSNGRSQSKFKNRSVARASKKRPS